MLYMFLNLNPDRSKADHLVEAHTLDKNLEVINTDRNGIQERDLSQVK